MVVVGVVSVVVVVVVAVVVVVIDVVAVVEDAELSGGICNSAGNWRVAIDWAPDATNFALWAT